MDYDRRMDRFGQLQDIIMENKLIISIFCLLFGIFVIVSLIVLSLIPLYLPSKHLNWVNNNSTTLFFDLTYGSNLINGSSLTVVNLENLADNLMQQVHLSKTTVNSARFVPQSTQNAIIQPRMTRANNIQCQTNVISTGDWFVLKLSIENPRKCRTSYCNKTFITEVKKHIDTLFNKIELPISFTNNQTLIVQLIFCSYGELFPGEPTLQTTIPTPQAIITKCQSAMSTAFAKKVQVSNLKNQQKKVKMLSAPEQIGNRILLKSTYMVEFASDAGVMDHFQTITDSLKASHGIHPSEIKKRCTIHSSLFSGASFTLTTNHPIEAIEMIKDAIAIYPVYTVPAPSPLKYLIFSDTTTSNNADSIMPHGLTGVDQVHQKLNNFGKGVRVAVIDTGIYYLHPALGGCFGPGCKVEFGYDFVGDSFGYNGNYTPVPDSDPLDNCSHVSHGTHVAGIIAANATEINETVFIPFEPFVGVAPQVTLGAYRVFGCIGGASSDIITQAIFRAYDDKADIITMSIGSSNPYTETSDGVAVQRVSDMGVYVTVSMGNDGGGGLQTGSNPANSPGVMAVASVDNMYTLEFLIIAPNGNKIPYLAGSAFGGWQSTVNSTIVVNDPNRTVSDGCSGPLKSVSGVVVLFAYSSMDMCGSAARCDLAADAGAIGCLLYNVGSITGSSKIPSGSISLDDGLSIVATVTTNPSAVYTFTDLLIPTPVKTGGTPSSFTSFGLNSDLEFKPQISGIGGYVYSTISLYAAQQQKLTRAYGILSGTSMACPYFAGTMALFLASIGNPAPNATNGYADNEICRPNLSVAKSIFQSSANISMIYNSSLFATVAQQGAGLVNAYQALTVTTIILPSELALNDSMRKATSYKMNVSNIGGQVAVYKISHGGAALATGATPNDDQLLNTPLYSTDYADVNIEPTEFQLQPGQSREITLQFQEPAKANAALLPIYSGFIYVTNEENGEVVHMSYAGVVGDYANARIIVRNTSSAIVTGIQNLNGEYVTNEQLPTLNATEGLLVTAVLAWSTRILFVDVVSAIDDILPGYNSSYGLVYGSDGILYTLDVPRNVAPPQTQSYVLSYPQLWLGEVGLIIVNEDGSYLNITNLLPGLYKIQFSILKHFGNYTNPDDFEVYHTPPFNLVY